MAQITDRYGRLAATVVNNHRGKLALSGITDLGTLDYLSRLLGDTDIDRISVTDQAGGGTLHQPLAAAGAPRPHRCAPPTTPRRRGPRLRLPAPRPRPVPAAGAYAPNGSPGRVRPLEDRPAASSAAAAAGAQLTLGTFRSTEFVLRVHRRSDASVDHLC
jgi:TraM recognition site of TraD and TraG